MSLHDFVIAKKTQHDKDWPMIARLVESHYARHSEASDDTMRSFLLRELRSPKILIDVAPSTPWIREQAQAVRPLLEHVIAGSESRLVAARLAEKEAGREADRHYWAPLKRELEQLRHSR